MSIHGLEDILSLADDAVANTDLVLVADTTGNARSERAPILASQQFVESVTDATITLTAAAHAGHTLVLNRAAGITVTLPAATGTGNVYRFAVGTTVTSNAYVIQVANATDVINGTLALSSDIAGVTISAGTSDDTITMSGTTTGGVRGSYLQVMDIASGVFMVTGTVVSSGAEADPFSAAVS